MVRKKVRPGNYYWDASQQKSVPAAPKLKEIEEVTQAAAYDAAVEGQQGVYGNLSPDGRRVIRFCPWCDKPLATDQALSGKCPHCYEVFANDVVVEQTEESEERAWRIWMLSKGADIRKAMDYVLEFGTKPDKHIKTRPPKAVLDACRMLGQNLGYFVEKSEHTFRIENLPMEQHVETAKMLIHAQQGIAVMPDDTVIRERIVKIDGQTKKIREPDQRLNLWFQKNHGIKLILGGANGEAGSLPALPDIRR